MLGKMIQVTDGCTFSEDLVKALQKKPLEVKAVYGQQDGRTAVGVAPEGYEEAAGDGLWCVIIPGEAELVEDQL